MAPGGTTCIVVENHFLAKPFLAAFRLKRSTDLGKLSSYRSDSLLLVESRGGGLAAAGTVGYVLGRHGADPATRLLHVGMSRATGPEGARLAGRVVLVNRVCDAASGRSYYPDILLAHEFFEAGVLSGPGAGQSGRSAAAGDRATTSGRAEGIGCAFPLADEQLSGFLAAALAFLGPHQVSCLSVVAGSADAEKATPGSVSEEGEAAIVLGEAMGAIVRLIDASVALSRPAVGRVGSETQGAIAEIARTLRLTASQSSQLVRLAEAAMVRGREVDRILADGGTLGPSRSKQERNRRFDELKSKLQQ